MCIDGGIICVPVIIFIANAIGLGGIATCIWCKLKRKKIVKHEGVPTSDIGCR